MLNEQVLSQFIPLNLITKEQMPQVIAAAQMHNVSKGAMLFKRGKTLTKSYYLLHGEVDLINSDFGVEKVCSGTDRASKSLNQKSPTPVSAVAKSSVTYISIDSAYVERCVANQRQSVHSDESLGDDAVVDIGMEVGELDDGQDWMSCILRSPLFSRIPMTQLQELFSRFEKVYVRKGERIVKEGACGDYFYVVASGAALVTDRSGTVNVELKQGDYFGEEALISDAPRNATVTMSVDGMLERLNAEDFAALVKAPVIHHLSWRDFTDMNKPVKVLDVRMPVEFRCGHAPNSINVPLSRLRKSIPELSKDTVYAVPGEAGARAEIATYLLCQAGLDAHVLNEGSVQSTSAAVSSAS